MRKSYTVWLLIFIVLLLVGCQASPGRITSNDQSKLEYSTDIKEKPTSVCQNECDRAGLRKCNGSDFQICEDYNSDSCLEFTPPTACPTGKKCFNGNCVDPCNQSNFKMAFIILKLKGNEVSQTSIDTLNSIKEAFSKNFAHATNNLAAMDTSYPIQIIELNSEEEKNNPVVAQRFYSHNPDDFDFLSIYGEGITPTLAGGNHVTIKNNIVGLGQPIIDITTQYGSLVNHRLKGINYMFDLKKDEFNKEGERLYSSGLLHETGHQWCCYLGKNFNGQNTSMVEIIIQNIHFYAGLESPYDVGDPMGSTYWVSNNDGTYRRGEFQWNEKRKYHPFVLYFMGILSESEYDTKFNLYNAGSADTGKSFNTDRATYYKSISVNDIIYAIGERYCWG